MNGQGQNMEQLLRDVCEYVLNKYGLPTVKLIFSKSRCSSIRYRTNGKFRYSLTVTTTWFCVDELAIASLLHELAHLRHHVAGNRFSHNKDFRKFEIEMLADFGLKPVGYKRAYYYTLQTINGKYSWKR